MPYSDFLLEEEEKNRQIYPETMAEPIGPDIPSPLAEGLRQYWNLWQKSRGPLGMPYEPTPAQPIPPAQSPVPQERYPVAGQVPGGPPLDVGDPAFAIKKLYSDLAKGGVKELTLGDIKAWTPEVKIHFKDPQVEAVKKQKQAQEKQQGITQQVYPGAPSGPMETGERAWGPVMTPGGGYMSPEEIAREKGQKAIFVPPLRPGEAPPSPEEWEANQKALLDKRITALKDNLRRTYPKRGELLNQAYEKLAKTSKLQRALMAFLKGNPWWTDEQAGIEADYMALQAEVMGKAEAGIITTEYDQRKAILDGLETRQKDKLARMAKEFDDRLELEPHLKYNKEAAKFQARRMGTPDAHVDEFVEDHKDPKTGAYTLIRPPSEERILRTKQLANEILLLNPMLPPQAAMVVAQRPTVLAELALEEIKLYEAKALYEENPRLREEYKDRANRAKNLAYSLQHNPAFRTYMMIEDDLKYNGDKMDAQTKAKALADLAEKHQEVFGQPLERDPEKLAMAKQKDAAYIRNAWLDAKLKEEVLQEKKEKPADNILMATAKKIHPGLHTAKPTQKVYDAAFTQQNIVLQMMTEDQIPPPPKDPMKELAGQRELRREAEELRKAAWKLVPEDVQKELVTLSYPEAAALVNGIFTAQAGGQIPNMPFLIDRYVRSRRNISKSKKK